MTSNEKMKQVLNKIDISYDDDLISKEYLIRTFEEFLCDTFSEEKHNTGIVLHTGSICFDVISLAFAAISNLVLNDNNTENVLDSIEDGDIVTYGKKRYIYRGKKKSKFVDVEQEYVLLEQEKNKEIDYIPQKRWNMIVPYYGESKTTGGRGLRKSIEQRQNFISEITGADKSEIPSVIDSSTVIVMSRERADDLLRKVTITYGEKKTIRLLDLVTASYYTENDEYNYGGNAEKVEPIIKVTSKLGVARKLVKKRSENEIKGLMILEQDGVTQNKSELAELIERKALGYVYASYSINSEMGDELVSLYPDAELFACTKEFLLQKTLPVQKTNLLTDRLEVQTGIIIDKAINRHVLQSEFTWEDFKKIKRQIKNVKYTESINDNKDNFVIQASALLNLLVTAPYTMTDLDECKNDINIVLPKDRLNELQSYAESFMYGMKDIAFEIIHSLTELYRTIVENNPKELALKKLLTDHRGKKIAIVVPKAYYIPVLQKTLRLYMGAKRVSIVTANRFDNENLYDRIIIVGDIKGKRFNPFKCKSAIDIDVILYEYENILFEHKCKKAEIREAEYNVRNRILDIDELDSLHVIEQQSEDVEEIENISDELDLFYEKLNVVAIKSLMSKGVPNGVQTLEVTKVAKFVEEESILFSKHYKAIVFDEEKADVVEKSVDDLLPGDILIFTKNDGFTKNIVDDILETLLEQKLLNSTIKAAYEKANYWKDLLRDYMDQNYLSYAELGKKFAEVGSTKHYGTIRSWIQPFSHIVGPQDVASYKHIAMLTKDPDMLMNPAAYYDACRIIRTERTKILELIAKAIISELSGNAPKDDKVLTLVFNNIDNLAVRLQIESITNLEEEYYAPMGMVNKPIVI